MKFSDSVANLGLALPIACPLATNTPITPAGILAALFPQADATTTSAGKNRPLQPPSSVGVWCRFTSAGLATIQIEFTLYRNGVAYTVLGPATTALTAADYDLELTLSVTGGGLQLNQATFYLVTAGVRAATGTTTTTTGLAFAAVEDIKIALRPAIATLSVTAGQVCVATS